MSYSFKIQNNQMQNKKALHFILIFFSILFQATISHAQEPGTWSTPKMHPCYQGISISVVNFGSDNRGGYSWGIKFFNDKYQTPVSFKYKLSIGEKITSKDAWLAVWKLGNGKSHSDAHDKSTAWTYQSSSEEWFVYLWDVCFDGMQCGGADECFAECDKVEGKENQLCGLSDQYKPTPGSNQLSLLSGNASAPVVDHNAEAAKGTASKWLTDNKEDELQIVKTEDGLLVKRKGEKDFKLYKKIGDKTYRLEEGKEFFIIKYSSDNKFGYWNTGVLENYYSLVAEEEVGAGKVRSGIWTGGTGGNVKITVQENGLIYHSINSVDDGSPFYKKISATEYRRDNADGITFCTLKLKEDNKLHYTCSDKPGAYIAISELTFLSADEEGKPDIGETTNWIRDDKKVQIEMGKTEKGIYWRRKGDKDYIYFFKVPGGNYRYETEKVFYLLQFVSETKVNFLDNGGVVNYYTLVAADEETKPVETDDEKFNFKGTTVWKDVVESKDYAYHYYAIIDRFLFEIEEGGNPDDIRWGSDGPETGKYFCYHKITPDKYDSYYSTRFITFLNKDKLVEREYDNGKTLKAERFANRIGTLSENSLPTASKETISIKNATGSWNYESMYDPKKRLTTLELFSDNDNKISIKKYNADKKYEYLYEKVSANVFEHKLKKVGTAKLVFLSPTRIFLSYVYKNCVSFGYYNKIAVPIVKQETKPAPATENKTEVGSTKISKWQDTNPCCPDIRYLATAPEGLYFTYEWGFPNGQTWEDKIKKGETKFGLLYNKISMNVYSDKQEQINYSLKHYGSSKIESYSRITFESNNRIKWEKIFARDRSEYVLYSYYFRLVE